MFETVRKASRSWQTLTAAPAWIAGWTRRTVLVTAVVAAGVPVMTGCNSVYHNARQSVPPAEQRSAARQKEAAAAVRESQTSLAQARTDSLANARRNADVLRLRAHELDRRAFAWNDALRRAASGNPGDPEGPLLLQGAAYALRAAADQLWSAGTLTASTAEDAQRALDAAHAATGEP